MEIISIDPKEVLRAAERLKIQEDRLELSRQYFKQDRLLRQRLLDISPFQAGDIVKVSIQPFNKALVEKECLVEEVLHGQPPYTYNFRLVYTETGEDASMRGVKKMELVTAEKDRQLHPVKFTFGDLVSYSKGKVVKYAKVFQYRPLEDAYHVMYTGNRGDVIPAKELTLVKAIELTEQT